MSFSVIPCKNDESKEKEETGTKGDRESLLLSEMWAWKQFKNSRV